LVGSGGGKKEIFMYDTMSGALSFLVLFVLLLLLLLVFTVTVVLLGSILWFSCYLLIAYCMGFSVLLLLLPLLVPSSFSISRFKLLLHFLDHCKNSRAILFFSERQVFGLGREGEKFQKFDKHYSW